jgi:hypothetical protein
MQTPKNANLLLTWLMSRDISQWNPRQIPDTELLCELKMRALDLPVQFLIYLISGKEERVVFGDEHKLPTSGIYGLFGDWLKNNGFREVNYTERSFVLSLNKIIKFKPMRIDGKPIHGYELDKELFTAMQTFTNGTCRFRGIYVSKHIKRAHACGLYFFSFADEV